MFTKRLRVVLIILLGNLLTAQTGLADSHLGKIVSFDDEEVEVKVKGEFDYWPASKLGTLPITILEKDSSNFVRIKSSNGAIVWVSLSYVTTDQQAAMKTSCQSQQLAQNANKKQYGVRGIGESCN
ncbi:MAG: hypothetical protein JKX75_08900 [Gammaproteobacteria bacterium]|nr:hypothetical protein [Gammaproteobacteria bacterium]